MSRLPRVFIDGVGFWSPALPGWDAARMAMQGQAPTTPADTPPQRPTAALLPANERRRAPDAVLLAVEAAQAAVLDSGHDAAQLASVFTSAHGDLAVVDALCSTLAANPLLLSPTRFHHSVHNAASGYWAIASGSRQGSTALAGYLYSFGAGLLEALALCVAEGAPVLLVGADTEARGPMASCNTSRGRLGVALVLSPHEGPRSRWSLDAVVGDGAAPASALAPASAPASAPQTAAALALAGNALADALPLFEALALTHDASITMAVGPRAALALRIAAQPPPRA